MSTEVSPTLTNIETIYKSLVWETSVAAAIAVLDYYVPILAVPPFSTIINGIINLCSNAVYNYFVLIVDVSVIKFQDAAHQSAYDKASEQLSIIAHDKGITSAEFIQARNDAKAALSKFTNFSI